MLDLIFGRRLNQFTVAMCDPCARTMGFGSTLDPARIELGAEAMLFLFISLLLVPTSVALTVTGVVGIVACAVALVWVLLRSNRTESALRLIRNGQVMELGFANPEGARLFSEANPGLRMAG